MVGQRGPAQGEPQGLCLALPQGSPLLQPRPLPQGQSWCWVPLRAVPVVWVGIPRSAASCSSADARGGVWGKAALSPSAGSVDFGPDVTSSDKSIKVLLNAQDKVSPHVLRGKRVLCARWLRGEAEGAFPPLSPHRERLGAAGPWSTGWDGLGYRETCSAGAARRGPCMQHVGPDSIWVTDGPRGDSTSSRCG